MSLRKNSVSGIIASVLPAIATLIVTPLYLREIGLEQFGVLALFWLFLGYFGVFEGGIGLAASQRIAVNTGNPEQRGRTAATALTLSLALGALGGVVLIPVAYVYFTTNQTIDTGGTSLITILAVLSVGILLVNISSLLGGILRTRSDHTSLNFISAISGVLIQVAPLGVALLWSKDLLWLLIAVIAARSIAIPIFYVMACRTVGARIKPTFEKAEVKALTSFGVWVTVSSLVSPLMTALDRFVLGVVQGAASVAAYTIGVQLSERVSVVPGAVIGSYFPIYASAKTEDRTEISRSFFKKYSILIMGMTVCIIVLSGPFLHVWVGEAVARQATPVAIVVAVGFWANMMARVPYLHLQAQGRPNIVAICHVIELPVYLVILYVSTRTLGLIGGAIAFSARCALDYLLLLRMSGDGAREWARQTIYGGSMLLIACIALFYWSTR